MNIGIVGLGLIGGSLGRVISARTENKVYAYDLSNTAMQDGKLLNAYQCELKKEDISRLDVLFLSLYPKALEENLEYYVQNLKDGAIVADCCGGKRKVVSKMQELAKKYPNVNFISSHPMAGREFSGVKHSTVGLFDKASMILINVNANLDVLEFFKKFCLSLGFGSVVITTWEEHDRIIAYTSQLAHLVSSSYIKSPTAQNYLGFSAGSFRDMTRVARLSPQMWSELMMENSENLISEINYLIENLNKYKLALESGDNQELRNLLQDGNDKKLNAEKLKNRRGL